MLFWGSIALVSATLSGLATAQSNGVWTVNFYNSPDCSAKSLTSTFTGSDVYVIHQVHPKGLYVKATNANKAVSGLAVAYADSGAFGVAEFVEGLCVAVPDGGATNFQVIVR